jgi:trehalose 6-phosphate synthase
VDRCDFTKGIPQRLLAVEKLFESSSRWRGRFTLLQIAVPSRSSVPAYRELQAFVHKEVERINGRFATPTWKPVVPVCDEQRREYLPTLYRSADLFLVNSLHDGMNLVAKEFVAARDDEDGVLILSRRAGAAHELLEALLIDPLDICASMKAIEVALCMPRGQRRYRMRCMRRTVERNNVYKWAGQIISDAAKARQLKERMFCRSHDN